MALWAHFHRLSPGMSTRHPKRMAQAKSTTARIWFFWRMASAVMWAFFCCPPAREAVFFFAEEAGAPRLAAGFLAAADLAAGFFAGKAFPPFSGSVAGALDFQPLLLSFTRLKKPGRPLSRRACYVGAGRPRRPGFLTALFSFFHRRGGACGRSSSPGSLWRRKGSPGNR